MFSFNWPVDSGSILSKFFLSRWSLSIFFLSCIASSNLSNGFISWLLVTQDLGRLFRQVQLPLDLFGAGCTDWDHACSWSPLDGALLNVERRPRQLAALVFHVLTLVRIQCPDMDVIFDRAPVFSALLGQRFLEILPAAKFYCTGQRLQLCYAICVVLLWRWIPVLSLLSMFLREEWSDFKAISCVLFRLQFHLFIEYWIATTVVMLFTEGLPTVG